MNNNFCAYLELIFIFYFIETNKHQSANIPSCIANVWMQFWFNGDSVYTSFSNHKNVEIGTWVAANLALLNCSLGAVCRQGDLFWNWNLGQWTLQREVFNSFFLAPQILIYLTSKIKKRDFFKHRYCSSTRHAKHNQLSSFPFSCDFPLVYKKDRE